MKSQYWSTLTRAVTPYVAGEQPKDRSYIKLNTNENPYPPSPAVLKAVAEAADARLRLYPDPSCGELRQVIAERYRLSCENVFIGNGSDEILAFAFMTFFEPGETIVFPDITYSFYPVYANLFRLDVRLVPLKDDFSIPIEEFLRPNGGVVIPNPNAPTGMALPLSAVSSIVKANRGHAVIIDEAYVDFGAESAAGLIKDNPNLLVVHTLSKSRSLAGLRVGYAMGGPELIQGLERIKESFNSYTVDRLAQAGAAAAIKDEISFKTSVEKIMRTRERVTIELEKIGFTVIPSKANFIFISHPRRPAAELFRELRERGILVRYFNKPRIDNYLRVTIGTEEEMHRFIETTTKILVPHTRI